MYKQARFDKDTLGKAEKDKRRYAAKLHLNCQKFKSQSTQTKLHLI